MVRQRQTIGECGPASRTLRGLTYLPSPEFAKGVHRVELHRSTSIRWPSLAPSDPTQFITPTHQSPRAVSLSTIHSSFFFTLPSLFYYSLVLLARELRISNSPNRIQLAVTPPFFYTHAKQIYISLVTKKDQTCQKDLINCFYFLITHGVCKKRKYCNRMSEKK